MAQTDYYGVELVPEGAQDWGSELNRVLGALTQLLALNQKPASVTLKWGDLTNGRTIECNLNGIQIRGGANFSLGQAKNFVFERGTSFPDPAVPGTVFFKTDEGPQGTLYICLNDLSWLAVSFVTEDTVRAAGGIVIPDLGIDPSDLGNIPISDGAGGLALIEPAGNNGMGLYADPTTLTGWRFALPHEEAALQFPAQGSLWIGAGLGSGVFLDMAPAVATGGLMRANAAEPSGLEWVAPLIALGTPYTAKAQLLAASAAGTAVVVSAPASAARVLLSDPTQASGLRWGLQTELGSVPSSKTTAFANLYAAQNFM